jgi:hypothetical protein
MTDDDELISLTKAIMFGTHHQPVSDEQAQGIIALVLGGREVANPAAYLRHALAQPDGARYGPPPRSDAAPTGGSAGLDLITLRKAMMLRAESPEEAAAAAETAHRGADLARQMLAERVRPEPVAAEVGGELHGAALAASQAEQSRAARSADRLPDPDPEPDDDTEDDEDDDSDDGEEPPY